MRGYQPSAFDYQRQIQNQNQTSVGQATPEEAREEARELRLISAVRKGFSEITWGLIFTGIAIGAASAVGNALGNILVEKYIRKERTR